MKCRFLRSLSGEFWERSWKWFHTKSKCCKILKTKWIGKIGVTLTNKSTLNFVLISSFVLKMTIFPNRLVFTHKVSHQFKGTQAKCSLLGNRESQIHMRDSPKVNVFYAVSRKKMFGSLFFLWANCHGSHFFGYVNSLVDATVTERHRQLHSPIEWCTGWTECEITLMNIFLTNGLEEPWTTTCNLAKWQLRSPDLTPCDSFL